MTTTRLTVGESTLIREPTTEYEALRIFFDVCEERGHASPSVTVDETGTVVTPPDHYDRMGEAFGGGERWAFCRKPRSEALGLPEGTDWMREHCMHLLFEGGSPYRAQPHLYTQVYVGSANQPAMLLPVCSASPPTFSHDGTRIAFLEERLGHITDDTPMAKYLLWEHDLVSAERRLVAGLPGSLGLGAATTAYSANDQWLLLNDFFQLTAYLVNLQDGLVIPVPIRTPAIDWHQQDPSLLVAAVPATERDRVDVVDFDLATGEQHLRSSLSSDVIDRFFLRELDVSSDGRYGLVTAPVGSSAKDQRENRGGVFAAAVVELDTGDIDPVMPAAFRTPGAQRRHTSPRWTETAPQTQASTKIGDALLDDAFRWSPEPADERVRADYGERYAEAAAGIIDAWSNKALSGRFAQELDQLLVGLAEVDAAQAAELTDRAHRTRRVPPPSRPLAEPPAPVPSRRRWFGHAREEPVARVQPEQAPRQTHNGLLLSAAEQMIRAQDAGEVLGAARRIVGGSPSGSVPWTWVASMTSDLLGAASYEATAKIALATFLWQEVYLPQVPQLGTSGLAATPPGQERLIMTNGFVACTHLSEESILISETGGSFPVGEVRSRCQYRLQELGE